MSVRDSLPAAAGSQKVAVIDLGSNSWRLVIFSYAPHLWWKRTDELYETVRIAAGLAATGRLAEEAIERALETLSVFTRFCRAQGIAAGEIHALATSAIRDAANRDEFVERAQAATGIRIEVLSAEDEARYGYLAAINTSTMADGAVVDVGGGSIQLVHVADRLTQSYCSFPLGAVRLTEQFLAGAGPPRKRELARLRAYVLKELGDASWLRAKGGRLVGLGGAVRNLAAAAQRAAGSPDLGVQGYLLTRRTLSELADELARLPTSERGSVPGIKPGRGDIILAAAVALESVLQVGDFRGVEVTEAGLREGAFLANTFLADRDPPLFEDVREAAVRNLATQYEPDLSHAEHVTRLAIQMHESLDSDGLFEPSPSERELLWAAAMLHDVGMTISYDDHHKHSHYLIVSAELPGFDPRERALIALISRFHRKGAPKLGEIAALARKGDEELLVRCAVILRLAEHLERGRDQSVSEARLHFGEDGVDLHLEAAGDLTLPRWSVERYGDDEAFERAFGRRLVIG
jgi:exopolyphosphatase / guanosine-5'-triphosphate,3'-diphosphate pyrophosphatase